MGEELRFSVTADASDFDSTMDGVEKKIDDTTKNTQKANSRFGKFTQGLGQVSGSFKSMSDEVSEKVGGISDALGLGSKGAKLMKAGIAGAIAAVAVVAVNKVREISTELGKLYDAKGVSQSTAKMDKSIKRLKTTIGSFTAPIANVLNETFGAIADGLNWILEKVRAAIAYMTGILETVFKPVIDGFNTVIGWLQDGINALTSFLGIGAIFKKSTENAEDAADAMGAVSEATSAGLASFDKLNTLDTSNMGDAEQSEKLNKEIQEAQENGRKLGDEINGWFANLDVGKVWDDFCDGVVEGYNELKRKIGKFFEDLSKTIGNVWNGFVTACGQAWNSIVSIATGAWNIIIDTALSIWNGLVSIIMGLWEGFKSTAETAWNNILKPGLEFIEKVVEPIKNGLEEAWKFMQKIVDGMKNAIGNTDLGETVKNSFSGAGEVASNTVQNFVKDPVGTTSSALSSFKENVGGAYNLTTVGKIDKVVSTVGNVVNGIGNALGGAVNTVKGWFGLASGGAVAPNNPMPYILGDNTKEYEIVSPVSLMEDAVMSAISKMGGTSGSSGPIELTVNLDGRKMARAIYDPLQTEGKRRGSSA